MQLEQKIVGVDMREEKELKDQRVPIMMTESELTAIDDWSFKNRIRSRGEAIRRLCQIGLIFDDHRAEFVDRFREIFAASHAAADEVSPLIQRGNLSEEERKIAKAVLKNLSAALGMVELVRVTTGLANNYKGEGDLRDIMAEAREILAIGDESDELNEP